MHWKLIHVCFHQVLSRMLELVAQPGGQSSQALAASAASNLEPGKLAPIPSSFDIFAASFSTKPGVVDPYLRESFSIAKSEGWDLNGDGGVIGNNVRIMSKRTRKALDNRGNDAAASLAVSVAMQGLPSSKFDMDLNDHDKSDSELMLGASAGGGGAAAGGTNASSLDAGIDDFYRGAAGGTTGNQMNNNSIDGGALDGIDAEIMSRYVHFVHVHLFNMRLLLMSPDRCCRMGVKALSVHTTQEFARQKQAKERAEKLAERIVSVLFIMLLALQIVLKRIDLYLYRSGSETPRTRKAASRPWISQLASRPSKIWQTGLFYFSPLCFFFL